ncbi:MAG: hypothetical protein ACRD7E_08075, partial [Bryobacteraceae bacterium]
GELSGHSGTSYFDPVPIRSIEIRLDAPFQSARAMRLDRLLDVETVRPGWYILASGIGRVRGHRAGVIADITRT